MSPPYWIINLLLIFFPNLLIIRFFMSSEEGSMSWVMLQPWHEAPAVGAVGLRAGAHRGGPLHCHVHGSFPSTALKEMQLGVRKRPGRHFHLSSSLLLPFQQPCSLLETLPWLSVQQCRAPRACQSSQPHPIVFQFGKCHCTLVLGSDISDPVKYVVISIVTAHAELKELMVVNMTTWCLGE